MGAEEGCPTLPYPGHIPGLDGIRGLAVGLVLLSHSVIYGQLGHLSFIGPDAGYTGVAIFFVLSGYLITTLLLREEQRKGTSSPFDSSTSAEG